MTSGAATLRVAVASKGDGVINQHFGHADAFLIYDLGPGSLTLVATREVAHYCQGGYGDEEKRDAILRSLADCCALFVARVGDGPKARLTAAGIEPIDAYPFSPIGEALPAWLASRSTP